MQFVLDNSVSMRWAFNDGSAKDQHFADGILALLELHENAQAIVPGLWWLELGNVLVGAENKGFITQKESEVFLDLIGALAIETDLSEHLGVRELIIPVAREHKLSAYDARYLSLCILRNLPLASLDRNLNLAAIQSGVALLAA